MRLVGHVQEPRFVPGSQLAGKLAGKDTLLAVDDLLGQHDGVGQVAAGIGHRSGDRGDRRPVVPVRLTRSERRPVLPTGQHDVGAALVPVVRMAQRPHQAPAVTLPGQTWEVLADLDAGGGRLDRRKLATELTGPLGLHVEGVVLRGSAGQEDEDHRTRLGDRGAGRGGSQCGEIGHTQAQQADRTGLQQLPASRHVWRAVGGGGCRACHRSHSSFAGPSTESRSEFGVTVDPSGPNPSPMSGGRSVAEPSSSKLHPLRSTFPSLPSHFPLIVT